MVAPVIIGGSGYRWRGRSIRAIVKDNTTCVTMPRRDSMIMAPASLSSNTQYKVTISASKNSGNGALLVNFFGGKHYDGEPISINVNSVDMKDYTVSVTAPVIPNSIPTYLRVWRPNNATGNVFVKTITYSVINGPLLVPRETKLPRKLTNTVKTPKPKSILAKSTIKLKETKGISIPVINTKENDEMKFKPYKATRPTYAADKVLIVNSEDVPRVSIITPTRDGIELIKKCYEAINANTCYPNWEWIVGDSKSSDGTAEYIKKLEDPRVKLVERNTTDGSFSSINNELVGFASGEYLLFLNDDTEPQPFWLFEMMSKIHRDPSVGIVGAKLLYSKGRVQHAGIAFIPQGPANLGKSVLGAFPPGFADRDRFFQAVTGACLLIRERDFRLIEGFDPIYHFCYEDVDLCLKVRYNLNKKVLYVSNAEVMHAESITQKKHKTAGQLQQAGIKVFKDRWMGKVEIDFPQYQKNMSKGLREVDVSFVTCVNNIPQYRTYVMGSLFKSATTKKYETIPVLNFGNPYSASQALNIGIEKANSNIVVLCHQDVLFYENWVDQLFERIAEVEKRTPKGKWGVLGTAGITKKEDTIGVVHSIKGSIQWQSSKRMLVCPVQTVDEHCMIIKKDSGLRFDEKNFNGFHFYGPDICLNAESRGLTNYGILAPLVHDSSSASLASGKREFMRLLNELAKKWRSKFELIRTTTSIIRKRNIRTFVKFKS